MESIGMVDLTAEYKCGDLYEPSKLGALEGHFVSVIETVRSALDPQI